MIHGGLSPSTWFRVLRSPISGSASDPRGRISRRARHAAHRLCLSDLAQLLRDRRRAGGDHRARHTREACPSSSMRAHAPHFHFCRGCRPAAEDLGADLRRRSRRTRSPPRCHRAACCCCGARRDIESLYEQVNELGLVSTSFSYPILASLEIGVQQLRTEGDRLWQQPSIAPRRCGDLSRDCPASACSGVEQASGPGFADLDRTRVTLELGSPA